MKAFIKSAFTVHFSLVFMSFIIFGTNDFTLNNPIINIIASILIIGVYLIGFYSDAFKITTVNIRNKVKTVTPVISWIVLYIIPVILLVWMSISPMEYGRWMPAEDTQSAAAESVESTEESEEPELVYTKVGIRQKAWFEIYMFPYKGIYHLAGKSIIAYAVTLLLMPIASILGYINGKRGVDLMKAAEKKYRKMVYKSEDDI